MFGALHLWWVHEKGVGDVAGTGWELAGIEDNKVDFLPCEFLNFFWEAFPRQGSEVI